MKSKIQTEEQMKIKFLPIQHLGLYIQSGFQVDPHNTQE